MDRDEAAAGTDVLLEVGARRIVLRRRRGVPEESIAALEKAYRALWSGDRPRAEALALLTAEIAVDPYVRKLVDSLR